MNSKLVKKLIIGIFPVLVIGVTAFFLLRDQTKPTPSTNETAQSPANSTNQPADINEGQGGEISEANQDRSITIDIGSESYEATLADNDTARAFRELLPLTLDMHDVNSNEKAYDFLNALPSNHTNPGNIQNGDLMLYGSRTLVLFYESFATSYTYTRIGQINDPADLSEALGSGNVEVTFKQ